MKKQTHEMNNLEMLDELQKHLSSDEILETLTEILSNQEMEQIFNYFQDCGCLEN